MLPCLTTTTQKAIIKKWLGGHQRRQIDPIEINRKGLLDILTINFPVFFLNRPPVYADANEAFLKITDNEDARLEHLLSEFKALFLRGMNSWERELGACPSNRAARSWNSI